MNAVLDPQSVLLFLWQASCQAACVLSLAFLLAARLPAARDRARMLHAAILCCGLTPLVSALLPHYILLPTPLPASVPFVDAADPTTVRSAGAPQTWIAVAVLIIWLAGLGLEIARIFYGWLRVRRVLHMSIPLNDERIQGMLQRIGSVKNLNLRVLPALESPFCWQMHRPVLVLPENLLCKPDDDLELLLRHEIAHLHAGDPYRLFLEHCVVAVFWFHLPVRRAMRHAQCWREIASDDRALAAGGSPRRLARLLTELAEQVAGPRSDAWQLSARGSTSDLQLRVLRLVSDRQSLELPTALRSLAFALTAAAVLLFAVVRLAGPFSLPQPGTWTHWPRLSGQLLDIAGVQVVDFDLHRAAHAPREQTPEHRAAHRKWRRPAPR
jgi:beta-lactamase regulating signal transducer with metallopeptidase domain